MIKTKYFVHSDVDDNNIYAEFDNQVDAISYASSFPVDDKVYVIASTVDVNDAGEITKEFDSEAVWTFEDLPGEDAFGVEDWPTVEYDAADELVQEPATELVKDVHEALEENEDLVECQECFDLFPKEECIKVNYGYVCPHCHSLVVKEVEIPAELKDEAPFDLDFPVPEDDGDEEEFISEVEDNGATTGLLTTENDGPMPEVSEQDVFVSNEEPETTNIETPVAFAELPVTVDEAGLDDGSSDESSDDSSDESLVEHIQDRPAPIEDETKLQGGDCAVVDCKTEHKIIAHSEDEKPLDCKMEKPALEEPLAGEEVEVKVTEDYPSLEKKLLDFAATLSEDVEGEVLEEGIFGIVTAKDIDGKFTDGYFVIGRDKAGEEKERKEFSNFKDAEKYASEYSKVSTNGLGSVIAKDGGKNTALKAFEDGKEVLNVIKDIFKDAKAAEKVKKQDEKAEQAMAEVSGKSVEEKPAEEAKPETAEVKEEPKAEEQPVKKDMSKQNKARADYAKLTKALQILHVDPKVLRDPETRKVTPEFRELRKVLFAESYHPEYLESEVKVGDKVKIISMEDEPGYAGKEGIVDHIDGIGQLHGSWGGLALIPGIDTFEVVSEGLVEATKKDAEEEPVDPETAKLEVHTMLNDLVRDEIEAIDGYEASKTEILDKPIEHKEDIIHTIDHIKDEEKEHIDELIDASEKISFEKSAVECLKEAEELGVNFEPGDEDDELKIELKGDISEEQINNLLKNIGDIFKKYGIEADVSAEKLEEASSAEKKAFKDGGEAYTDLIQGKAIARIKDPAARDAAVAAIKAGRPEVASEFIGDRKEAQAERSFEKKAGKMQDAGIEVEEDLHKNSEALVAE